MRHIDFHITVDQYATALEIHEIIGCLKKAMWEEFHNTRVNIHVDPVCEEEQLDSCNTKSQQEHRPQI
jgi:divalent metal cation (Fe/Co/Zn/Cd) transporter